MSKRYKKALLAAIAVVVIMVTVACNTQGVDTKPTQKTPEVAYGIIDWYGYDVKEGEGARKGNFVPDAVTAQAIGDAVIKGIVGEERFKELIGVSIQYDEAKDVWLVNRNLGPYGVGGDYTCAIRKNSGEILTVVAGE